MGSGANNGEVDYIVWETPYSVADASPVDRMAGPLSNADHLYIINHSLNFKLFESNSLIVPDRVHAGRTNSAGS